MKLIKLLTRTFFLILVLMNLSSVAQETKIPIAGNALLQQYAKDHPERVHQEKHIQSALSLPFFDDFSTSYVYPDSNKWIGKSVYINEDFPVDPPTIGVATFDGLDSVGVPYLNAPSGDYPADTLTSRPIDLSAPYATDSTIYLSFFYQSGGRALAPNDGDSLILQFMNKDSVWVTVWEADGNSSPTNFQQVFVHVYDTIYYFNGFTYDTLVDTFRTSYFQFRFMNLVSGFGMEAIWNIDYVVMNNNRSPSDTTLLDMAFVYRGPSFLKNYSQMPWTHYKASDTASQMVIQYPLVIRNNYIDSPVIFLHSQIYEYGNPTPIYIYPGTGNAGYSFNAMSNDSLILIKANGAPSAFAFPTNVSDTDFAEFTVIHYIENTAGDAVLSNDTIKNVQRFSDFYAYDDGTAEWGLGLVNAPGGEIAMQFTTTKSDTCEGVYIFWPHLVYDTRQYDFSIAIWGDAGGQPGNLIYVKSGLLPNYDSTELNGFTYYRLDSNTVNVFRGLNQDTIFSIPYLTAGTYYFGFIDGIDWFDNSNPLAIGLDENSNWDSTKLWINTNSAWSPSTVQGTIMIRPVFGSSLDLGIKKINNQLASSLSIFPNPASDKINLNWTSQDHIQANDLLVQIYDPQERLILSQAGFQNQIDISSVSEGFYLIKVTDTKTLTSFTDKLIINR